MSNPTAVRAIFAAALLCGVNGAYAAPPLPFSRFHFQQEIPLQPDTSRVAVQLAKSRAALDGELGLLGLSTRDSRPHTLSTWIYLETPRNLRNSSTANDDLAALVGQLAKLDSVAFAAPVFLDRNGWPMHPGPTVLVAFEDDGARQRTAQTLSRGTLGRWSVIPNAYKLEIGTKNGLEVMEQANALAQQAGVVFAEPDFTIQGRSSQFPVPNDPDWGLLWGLENTGQSGGLVDFDMDALDAWAITTGTSSVPVLIIDTGVDQAHPDINQTAGVDYTGENVPGGGPGNECDNHGTPVAGAVSSAINNNEGVVGIAPNCPAVSARCFVSNIPCNGSWTAAYSWTVDAITDAFAGGIRVTNNSNYYGGSSAAMELAYAATRTAGMIHFASAGNNNAATLAYPASLPEVMSVAAAQRDGQKSSFSNYNADNFISAPGTSIVLPDRVGADGYVTSDYASVNGTSFASPYAAGVAALMLSITPVLTGSEVESLMASTAVDAGSVGPDAQFGAGLVNAGAAVAAAQLAPVALDFFLIE